jgi:hypothetical protein
MSEKETIPNSLAVVYNWICLVLAVLVIELLLLRKQHSLTTGITGKQRSQPEAGPLHNLCWLAT